MFVGIFHNEDANIRLVSALLLEQNDEWLVQRGRYMRLETTAPLGDDPIIDNSANLGTCTTSAGRISSGIFADRIGGSARAVRGRPTGPRRRLRSRPDPAQPQGAGL